MCTSVYTTDFAATDLASSFSFSRYDVVFAARVTFRLAWKVHFRVLCIYPRRLAGSGWAGCVCALRFPFTRTLDSSKASVALHSRSETGHHDVTCTAC